MVDQVLTDDQLKKIKAEWQSEASLKKIEENWTEFEKWASKVGDHRKDKVMAMLDVFSEQACMAPASSRFEFHNAFPGGFIDHSLRVMNYTVKMAQALGVKGVKPESIIISTLFHDWGKAGSTEDPYYIAEESDWHQKRGKTYNRNQTIKIPNNAQLGLFNLAQFGIELTQEEYLAILLNDGPYSDSNKDYRMKEPQLALIVHMADRWSTQCEKNRKSILEPAVPKF